jgi:hypothetical protein
MAESNGSDPNIDISVEFQGRQLQLIETPNSHCKSMQLPEGLLLRYTLAKTLYFYLRSGTRDANISTRVFASDSPYERCKTEIGEVLTPIFGDNPDEAHLTKVQQMLHSWVKFVREQTDDDGEDFVSFQLTMGPRN